MNQHQSKPPDNEQPTIEDIVGVHVLIEAEEDLTVRHVHPPQPEILEDRFLPVTDSALSNIYTPEDAVSIIHTRAKQVHFDHAWFILYRSRDLEEPFYSLVRQLLRDRVSVTFWIHEEPFVYANLESRLKKELTSAELANLSYHETKAEIYKLTNMAMFFSGTRTDPQNLLVFSTSRDDFGRTDLCWLKPPNEGKRAFHYVTGVFAENDEPSYPRLHDAG